MLYKTSTISILKIFYILRDETKTQLTPFLGEFMKMVLLSLLSLLAVNAFAESRLLSQPDLTGCGGKVELRLADNGDLALKFASSQSNYNGSQFDKNRCTYLRFVDHSSRSLIKEYAIKGTSYTLSSKMRESLGEDCQLDVLLDNGAVTTQTIKVYIPGCRPVAKVWPKSPYSYELSGKNNCKLMENGVFTNNLAKDDYCAILSGKKNVSVKYEYSNSGNCKIMFNGVFQQQLPFAHASFCQGTR